MGKEGSDSERRRDDRFNPRGVTPVVLLSEEAELVCALRDISVGGIGLNYVDLGNNLGDRCGKKVMFLNGDDVLKDIHGIVKWDFPKQSGFASHIVKIRKCGIQFEPLKAEQLDVVKKFINGFSPGTAL